MEVLHRFLLSGPGKTFSSCGPWRSFILLDEPELALSIPVLQKIEIAGHELDGF